MAVLDVEVEKSMDAAISGFWYAYAFGRNRFRRLLNGLTPEQLAFKPAGFNNSLAAVIVHVAGVEVNFAYRIMGQEVPAELKAEFLLDQPHPPLPQPAGETVESLVAKLAKAEGLIKEALSALTVLDLDREIKASGDGAYTLRWLLSLVSYHATNHFGQLQMIKQHLG